MENAKMAKIFIRASQSDRNGIIDSMEFFTEGKYYNKDSSQYVTYKESDISGMAGTTSTLKLSGETVSLIRTGHINSRFVFDKNRETRTVYQTGYGIFNIMVRTDKLEIQYVDELSFVIRLRYELQFEVQDVIINEMEIKVTLSR